MQFFTFPKLAVILAMTAVLSVQVHADAKLAKASGTAKVTIKGEESEAASKIDGVLPPGTVVTTGPDGKVIIELAPGFVIELQPNSMVTIGETTYGAAVDELGNPIPQHSITLTSGTIVSVTNELGLAGASLVVVTPRGSITPTAPGQTVITVTGVDPARATVTVASTTGSELVTKTSGEQVPVPEGLAVILRPDDLGDLGPMLIMDLPNGAAIMAMSQSAANDIGGLGNLTPVQLPPILPPILPDGGIPPITPPGPSTPTPTPTPTPAPTPTPTPAPVSP